MKKFLILIISIFIGGFCAFAQDHTTYVKEGNSFVYKAPEKQEILTTYTWQDSKGVVYPIYLHKYTKGEKEGTWTAYVKKVSKKTGNEYNYYIPNGAEIAKEILKETNYE